MRQTDDRRRRVHPIATTCGAAGLALSALLPPAGAFFAALAAPAPAHAQQAAAAPARAAKVRVRVYLAELRCPQWQGGGDPNYKAEPYLAGVFQGDTEMPNLAVALPASIKTTDATWKNPAIHRYPAGMLLLDATMAPGTSVRGGLTFNEDDGTYKWGETDREGTITGAQARVLTALNRVGRDRKLTMQELQALATASFPVNGGGTVGTPIDPDDHLADYPLEFPTDGPLLHEHVLEAKGSQYIYHVSLKVLREPLREDGTPIYSAGAPPAPSTPDTGVVVGGDFRAVGDTGFAARVDRVKYGAGVNDPNVTVTVTYRNVTPFPKRLRPGDVNAGLLLRGANPLPWNGQGLTWPGPAHVPQGAVPPGQEIAPDGLCTTTYTFPVGDGAKQQTVEQLSVHEPKAGAKTHEFALPAYKPYTTPVETQPDAGAVQDLRRLAGRYRTNEGTVITVRVDGKYLSANGVTEESAGTSVPRQAESWSLGLQGDNRTLEGAWNDYRKTREQSGHLGRAKVTFSADGKSFTGAVQPSSGLAAFPYSGTRIEDAPEPGAPAPEPGGGYVEGPVPASDAAFVPVDSYFALRLDALRRRRADQVEAVVTVRNVSARDARLGMGSLNLTVEAPDGAARFSASGTLYGASGYIPQRLPEGPLLHPSDEVQVRYLFNGVPEAVRSLRRLTARGSGGATAALDLGGIAPLTGGGSGGALSLRYFDVRLEGLRRDRSGEWEAVLAVRNADFSARGVAPGGFEMSLLDANGASIKCAGRFYQVSPAEPRVAFAAAPVAEPGETVRIRVHFPNSRGLAPTRYRVSDGIAKTAPLSSIAP